MTNLDNPWIHLTNYSLNKDDNSESDPESNNEQKILWKKCKMSHLLSIDRAVNFVMKDFEW